MIKWIISVIFSTLIYLCTTVAFASEAPAGFCGYSWGTPLEDFPDTTFVTHFITSKYSLYDIDEADIDVSNLIGNAVPAKVSVLFMDNKLFSGQINLERKYGDAVRKWLIDQYGDPTVTDSGYSKTGGSWVSYRWENDQSIASLYVFFDNVKLEVEDAIHYRTQSNLIK